MNKTHKHYRPLSWIPRRRGAIYCAPACGHGCTYAAYERATENARRLAAILSFATHATWLPHVWENLGWHYEAYCGVARVYQSGCLLGDDLQSDGGSSLWTSTSPNDDPIEILNHEVDSMLKRTRRILKAVRSNTYAAGRLAEYQKLLKKLAK